MADVLDQENTSGTLGIGFGDVGNSRDYLSQSFIPGSGVTNVSAISAYLNGKSGTSTQGYRVWIDNADSSGHPTGAIGGIGGDTEILNSALVTGALTKYALSSPIAVTAGNRYCFVLAPWNTTTHDYSSDYQDWSCSVSNPYANGKRSHGNTAYDTWGDPDSGNADLQFRTYYSDTFSSSVIKSVNALVKASVKSVKGLVIASVKKINGLT